MPPGLVPPGLVPPGLVLGPTEPPIPPLDPVVRPGFAPGVRTMTPPPVTGLARPEPGLDGGTPGVGGREDPPMPPREPPSADPPPEPPAFAMERLGSVLRVMPPASGIPLGGITGTAALAGNLPEPLSSR